MKPDYSIFREMNSPNKSRGLDFFAPGIRAIKPAGRHMNLEVRLLPAFDEGQFSKESFPVSVTGYRREDEELGGFYTTLRAHSYWGRTETGMVSPGSLRYICPGEYTELEMKDPIENCYRTARRNDKWRHLTERRGSREPVLEMAKALVLFNASYRHSGRPWEQGILIVSSQCREHLERQLNMRQPAGDPRLHSQERYRKYLLGDVTDPNEGLVARVFKADSGPASPFCLHYTSGTSYDIQRMPIGEDELRRRVDFGGEDWCKIPTPQQMVDIMVADGFLPLELIQKACGHYANVPSR